LQDQENLKNREGREGGGGRDKVEAVDKGCGDDNDNSEGGSDDMGGALFEGRGVMVGF
jgi:hypothetical protein